MKLPTLLQSLVKEAVMVCDRWRRENRLSKDVRYYYRYKVDKLVYVKGKCGFSGNIQPVQKEIWEVENLVKYIKNSPSFKNCVKYLAEEYAFNSPNPQTKAEYWLSLFLRKVLFDYLYERFKSERDIPVYVTIFVNDLEGNPIEWEIKVWLEGIWMGIERLEIERGLVIRKPKPYDLEYEFHAEGVPFPRKPHSCPSAIIEIKKRVEIQPFSYPELEKIIVALQLYKVGSVVKTYIEFSPNSFLKSGGSILLLPSWTLTYTYSIDEPDRKRLPQFIMRIKDMLPFEEARISASTPIGIALSRYQDALLKQEPFENKIARSVMGLEALYLKREEKEELSRRLAQRVAKLLSFFGEDPIEAYDLIKKSYKIRSDYVHGAPVKIKGGEAKKILDKVVECLRKSILVFMQTKEEKSTLLTLIGNALLERQADKELEEIF